MRKNIMIALCALFTASTGWAASGGEVPSRAEIPDEFKWHLSDIYATDAAWDASHDALRARLPELAAHRGHLGESAKALLACLRLSDELSIEVGKLYVYAHMKSHEDTSLAAYQAMSAKATKLAVDLGAASSFITPEIISVGRERLEKFIDPAETGHDFDDYRFMIREILRGQEHVLSPAEEELLAKTGEMSSTAENAYSMLTNADMKFPFIKDEDGKETELTEERYMSFISSRERSVRRAAFEALYETYGKSSNTIGATFAGMLKSSRFYADVRKFGSDLEASLHGPNIPVEVYDNLVDTIESNLAPLHRYVALRKRALGLDELHMYDIYCPLVDDPYKDIPWETAKQMATDALRPLGADYMARFTEGLSGGWIDVYANKGKRGGAYSWGTYGTHPYILLNYNGKLNDVMTLVHEMGHSMHSLYSREKQPPSMCDYTTFCAEVASTANEELLLDHLLRTTEDLDKRIYLLGSRLERIRATVYRQTMFASFERTVHEREQRGEDVTAETLGRIWHELNVKYFGPEIVVDELIDREWSRIPHFYSPFYVYQYATGFSAAAALAHGVLRDGEPAVARYIDYLSSGGSDYSIELLKRAGVDMSTPEPIRDVIRIFSETLDEMERLLAEKAKS